MSRRYDSKTNTFTSDGRLMQVEYAIEAINKAGSAIGILTKDGIVITTEKQDTSFLLEQTKDSEKIYCLDRHLYCAVGGVTADANYLIDVARQILLGYRKQFREDMPIEQLVVRICDINQSYTHFGGKRPLGTGFLFAGFDKNHKYQLYSTDPSGNYAGWKATAIGQGNVTANQFLKQEYKETLTLEQGIGLGLKSLIKTMDTGRPSAKKIEIVLLTQNSQGVVSGRSLTEKEISEQLIKNGYAQDQMEQE